MTQEEYSLKDKAAEMWRLSSEQQDRHTHKFMKRYLTFCVANYAYFFAYLMLDALIQKLKKTCITHDLN